MAVAILYLGGSIDIYHRAQLDDDRNTIVLSKESKQLVRSSELSLPAIAGEDWWSLEGEDKPHLVVIFGLFSIHPRRYCQDEYERYLVYCSPDSESSLEDSALETRICLRHFLNYLATCEEVTIEADLEQASSLYLQAWESGQALSVEELARQDEMFARFLEWQEDVPDGVGYLFEEITKLPRDHLLEFALNNKQCLAKWYRAAFGMGKMRLENLSKAELIYLLLLVALTNGAFCFNINDLFGTS